MDLERVIVRFMADATQYNRVMDGVDARLRNFARSAGGLASFIVSPIAAATESLVALSRVVVDSGRYAVHTAMQYEQLGIQLEVIAKDADKGKQMLEDMFQVAINTPFQVKEVAAAGKELAAFGFSVEEIVPLVKQLGDVSAGTGTPMHRLILAFGQAKIAGRLMGQEMRQFVNANVPMIEHLAAVLGKPTMQIKKMIENGQIGFDIVQQAMNRMTGEGGIFGGMMERMNKTAIGQWRSFIESLEIGLYKVGKVFFEVFDLQDTFRSWKEWAMDTSQDAGGLKTVFEDIQKVLHGIRSAFLFAVEAGRRLLVVLTDIGESIIAWGDRNKDVVKVLIMIVATTTAIRIAVWAATAAFTAMRAVILSIRAILAVNALIGILTFPITIAAIGSALSAVIVPLTAVVGLFGLIYQIGAEGGFFENFGKSFLEAFNSLSETMKIVWKGVTDAINVKDFPLAFDIAFKGILIGWRTLLITMGAEWYRFRKSFELNIGNNFDAGFGILDVQVRKGLASLFDEMGLGHLVNKKGIARDEMEILQEHGRRQAEIDASIEMETKKRLTEDPRLNQLKQELNALITKIPESNYTPEVKRFLEVVKESQNRAVSAGHPLAYHQNEIQSIDSITSRITEAVERQFKAYQEMKRFSKYGMFDPDFMGAANRVSNIQGTIDKLKSDRQWIMDRPMRDALEITQFVRGIVGQIGGVPGGTFNTSSIQYSLSGEAKSLAEKVQQQYMRGVGEETHKYDYFMKNMGLIDQARTGMTPDYKAAFDTAGPISKMFLQAGASKNTALSADEADYGLLNEFDKIKKYVGDRMSTGPRAMAFGSSEAQDTINRAVTQQVPVLDQIRVIMEASKDMQRAQLEYQKQAVDALRELSGSKPPTAPMPREAGFAVDKP